jgi:hypothetical protein
MTTTNLKFKKLGWFCDEASARYGAIISEHTNVVIYKCAYSNQWVTRFMSKNNWFLSSLNSGWEWSDSKSEAIYIINNFLTPENVAYLDGLSIAEDKLMENYNS